MPKISTIHTVQRGEIVELASDSLVDSKTLTIQIIRAGEFTDMHGKDFELTSADLDAYIANSNALIAQEQVPIELGHPEGENASSAPAAAWYKKFFKKAIDGVEWVCAEIELTALGTQSLADQLYKYFSANVWLDAQTICGGGFVNRPAVSGQQPVGSLAQYLHPKSKGDDPVSEPKNLLQLFADEMKKLIAKLEMSQEDQATKIRKALQKKYADPMSVGWNYPYPIATFADRVIVTKDDKYFSLPYTFNANGDCELGDAVEVEATWQEKQTASPDSATLAAPVLPNPVPVNQTPAPAQENKEGGETKMSDQNTAPVIPTENPLPVATIDLALPVEEQIRLAKEQAADAARASVREFEARLAAERKSAWEQAQAEMARKQEVASLSQKLTGGVRSLPFSSKELEDELGKLSDAGRVIVAKLLTKIHDNGLVELGEIGSSGKGFIGKELPAYVKPLLTTFLAKRGTIHDFFAANVELGSADQYDLHEFQTK